jgi:hypothetical protein
VIIPDVFGGRRPLTPSPLPVGGEGEFSSLRLTVGTSASPLEGRGREERAGEGW